MQTFTYPLWRSITPRSLKIAGSLLVLFAIVAFTPLNLQARPIGINFQTEGHPGFSAGKSVSSQALGVAATNWSNLTAGPAGTRIISVPGGGSLVVSWNSANTWGVDMGLPPGNNDVYWGYLDDSGTGFSVTIAGLGGVFSNYVVQAVASTDQGNTFQPVTIIPAVSAAQTLTFSATVAGTPNRLAGVSSASTVLNSDSIQVQGLPKAAFNRGTLAGLILTDVPVIEAQPQAPTNEVHEGESFSVSVGAIGPNLTYQWRRNGSNIAGANGSTLFRFNATTNDNGRYDVIVADAFDTVLSSNVTVTVHSASGAAPVIFSAKPATFQLYPRDRQSNKAGVAISGTVVAPLYDHIVVEVDREGVSYTTVTKALSYANGTAAFSIVVPIPAELANYNFKIYVQGGLSRTLVASA
ncbi:MAG TPA: immunoglobulin domain-containing protein, partial [Desulfuromonadaceae bacterium]|nr:immunoglobulin domain-containing protein [Desulfuromonadaceae bacterium]